METGDGDLRWKWRWEMEMKIGLEPDFGHAPYSACNFTTLHYISEIA